jgi:glycosyltransferase involved in cell wall biosynthesis
MAELRGVSVVIPTYNRADLLGEAIETAFAQDAPELEVVVVDDGSTDETPQLLDALREKHGPALTVIRQANAGESAARNEGIRRARHELVALLDSDNRWRPHKLGRQLAIHAAHPEIEFSFTGYETLGAARGEPVIVGDWSDASRDALEQLLVGCCVNTSTVVASKRVLTEVGLFDTSLVCCQDHDLWLRLAAAGCRMGYVPDSLLEYRVHPGGTSSDPALVAASTELVFQRLFAGGALPDDVASRRRFYMARCYLNSSVRYLEARDGGGALRALGRAFRTRPASARPGWLKLAARALVLAARRGGSDQVATARAASRAG